MADETPDAVHEWTGLYVLGALDAVDAAAFEAHLASCEACTAEMRTLRDIAAALPFGLWMVSPSPELRARVLAIANEPTAGTVVPFAPLESSTHARPGRYAGKRSVGLVAGWVAAAATLLLAAAAGVHASRLQDRLDIAERRLADASARLTDAQSALTAARADATGVRASLALLTSPDSLDLQLSGQAPARQARGRAVISQSRGLIFAASNLPPLPPTRTYQLWYLTAGAPVSAGLVQPDADGSVLAAFPGPAPLASPQGFAVSLEPEGGVPAPTGAIYLATQ